MRRVIGVLAMVLVLYLVLVGSFDSARSLANHLDLARRLGFYGVLTLGVGILIVAGGIDLSIGSLVGLGAVNFGLLLPIFARHGEPFGRLWPFAAAGVIIAGAALVGLFHGLLITKL